MDSTRNRIVAGVVGLMLALFVAWMLLPSPPALPDEEPVVVARKEAPPLPEIAAPTPVVRTAEPSAIPKEVLDVLAEPVKPSPVSKFMNDDSPDVAYCRLPTGVSSERVTAFFEASDGARARVSTSSEEGVLKLSGLNKHREWLDTHQPGSSVPIMLRIYREGVAYGSVGWSSSGWTCGVSRFETYARIEGVVETSVGLKEGRVTVQGCGRKATVAPDGRFSFVAYQEEPCELRAVRQDGRVTTRSEPVILEFEPGDKEFVRLWLPDAQSGAVSRGREAIEAIGARDAVVIRGPAR